MSLNLFNELSGVLDKSQVFEPHASSPYLHDSTESRGMKGKADLIVLPGTLEEVQKVVAYAYDHDLPMTLRGGGTGYAGGAVPEGGLVICLEKMNKVCSVDPLQWRLQVEAGVSTRRVQTVCRENGLLYPPDPGAAEQSQIGGNLATNAGGPHTFKYGSTGKWVTGVEAVTGWGEKVSFGGGFRKDVAGLDLGSLLVGSEGTLGVITRVHLRAMPALEKRYPVVGWYKSLREGCEALDYVRASGIQPAVLEYLDEGCIKWTQLSGAMEGSQFMLLTEADGTGEEAWAGRGILIEAVSEGALRVDAPLEEVAIADLWRWREGVGLGLAARWGGKSSEDIVVPLDRVEEAIRRIPEIGLKYGLEACSFGHAGDGNLHATFLLDFNDPDALASSQEAAEELFAMAIEMEGSVSGEHGIGKVKNGQLQHQWNPASVRLAQEVKKTFDPKGLFNPGKKLA
jgi:FAD/FMN-containing dehydrogenase